MHVALKYLTIALQDQIDYGFSSANWNPVGLNDGEYELMALVSCDPSGLHFPPPGIDNYKSAVVSGVRCCF